MLHKAKNDGPEKLPTGIQDPLIISTGTQGRAGRPAKMWEDDLNDFVKMKKRRPLSTVGKRKKDKPYTLSTSGEPDPTTISVKMITVLTRYRPIVLELI